jgi:hypothetical protein
VLKVRGESDLRRGNESRAEALSEDVGLGFEVTARCVSPTTKSSRPSLFDHRPRPSRRLE